MSLELIKLIAMITLVIKAEGLYAHGLKLVVIPIYSNKTMWDVSYMKILVVGGGGFLGAEIVTNLIESGFEVKSLSRNMSSTLPCEQFIADIQNPDSYKNILSAWLPEVVIQAAWVTDQKIYRTSSLNSSYMNATAFLFESKFLS